MSETTETTAPEATEAEGAQQDTTEQLGDGGTKALKAEREARKNAERTAAELKARLDQFEQANLSDLERANKAAADAAAELAALRTENVRSRVALEKGIPNDLVEFLTGDDEDAIAAKADLLLSRLNTPTTPKPDLSQGAKGTEKKSSTGDQFADFFTTNLSS